MALKNYGELKTELANYLDREDQDNNIPTFVKLAETRIFRKLRSRENEFTASYDENTTPAPFNPITLPQNYREMHLCMINGEPIEHISSQEFFRRKRSNYQGPETWFTIIGQELHLIPWADSEADLGETFAIDIIYYGTESLGEMATWQTPRNPNTVPESDGTPANTTMRADESTTRLLLTSPDVLLFGSLVEAYRFLREPKKVQEWKPQFEEALGELILENEMSLFSGSSTAVASSYGDGERI